MAEVPQDTFAAPRRVLAKARLSCGHMKWDWKKHPIIGWAEWCRACHDFQKMVSHNG